MTDPADIAEHRKDAEYLARLSRQEASGEVRIDDLVAAIRAHRLPFEASKADRRFNEGLTAAIKAIRASAQPLADAGDVERAVKEVREYLDDAAFGTRKGDSIEDFKEACRALLRAIRALPSTAPDDEPADAHPLARMVALDEETAAGMSPEDADAYMHGDPTAPDELVQRLRWIIDPAADAGKRIERRASLTNHDIRQCIAALARPDRMAEMEGALRDIAAERRRQIDVEGWTPEHDDEHSDGAMAKAAACYADQSTLSDEARAITAEWPSDRWPWDRGWWKPQDRRRDLIRAGALIAAEIERIDRAALSASEGGR